jgi:hypothetical protein
MPHARYPLALSVLCGTESRVGAEPQECHIGAALAPRIFDQTTPTLSHMKLKPHHDTLCSLEDLGWSYHRRSAVHAAQLAYQPVTTRPAHPSARHFQHSLSHYDREAVDLELLDFAIIYVQAAPLACSLFGQRNHGQRFNTLFLDNTLLLCHLDASYDTIVHVHGADSARTSRHQCIQRSSQDETL